MRRTPVMTNEHSEHNFMYKNTNQPQANQGAAVLVGSGTLLGVWIPVSEQMPKPIKKVLVCGHWDNGNRWRTCAAFWPAGSLDAADWDDPPDDWWDETGDKCLCPHDAWLEEFVEECPQYSWLKNVTHWMELPAMPNK